MSWIITVSQQHKLVRHDFLMTSLFFLSYYSNKNFIFLIEVQLIYNVVLVSSVQQSDLVLSFFRFFSIIGYCKVLSIIPCALHQVFVGYLLYIQQCVCVNPKLLIYFPLLPCFLDYSKFYIRNPNKKHWLTQVKKSIETVHCVVYKELCQINIAFSFCERSSNKQDKI